MWNCRSACSKWSLELFAKNTPDEHQPELYFCIWETSCGHHRHCNVPLLPCSHLGAIHASIHLTLPCSLCPFSRYPTPPPPAPLDTAGTGQLRRMTPSSHQAGGVFPTDVETRVKALNFMCLGWVSQGMEIILSLERLLFVVDYSVHAELMSWVRNTSKQTGLYLEVGKWLKTVWLLTPVAFYFYVLAFTTTVLHAHVFYQNCFHGEIFNYLFLLT